MAHAHELVVYREYPLYLDKWDTEVMAVRTDDGRNFLAFRHLCEAIGVGFDNQKDVLAAHPEWYPPESQSHFNVTTAGGKQDMLFLRSQEAAWWMTHVSPRRVRAIVRGRLEEFVADVKAAMDRLAWGNLSDVPVSQALVPAPRGVLYIACPRCKLHIRVVARDGGIFAEVDD